MGKYDEAKKAIDKQDYKKATLLFSQICNVESDNFLAYQGLAESYFFQGDSNTAKKMAFRALEINSSLAIPHLIIANVLFNEKEYTVAEEEVHLCLEVDKTLSGAYTTLAKIYLATGRTTDAIELLEASLNVVAVKKWRIHEALANLYTIENKDTFARKNFYETMRLRPSWYNVCRFLYFELYLHRTAFTFAILTGFLISFSTPYFLGKTFSIWIFCITEFLFSTTAIISYSVGNKKNAYMILGIVFIALAIYFFYLRGTI